MAGRIGRSGGKRPGTGRKAGAAWAGKVTPGVTSMREEARIRVRHVLAESKDPLTVLCEMAADETRPDSLRLEAAQAACPYMFPRLSAAMVATAPVSARDETGAIVQRLLDRFSRLAPPPPPTIEGTPPERVEAEN